MNGNNNEKLKDDLRNVYYESREKGREQIERAKQAMQEKRGRARGYIRENPEKSALMAAGIGAAAALLLMTIMRVKKRMRHY